MNTYIRCLICTLLIILCCACQSGDDEQDIALDLKSPEYTEFQWLLIHQGQLLLIEQGEHLWPAYQSDKAVLESMPPQIHLARYFDQQIQSKAVNLIIPPPLVTSADFNAQQWDGKIWQNVADFRLVGSRYEIKVNSQSSWQGALNEQIRFQRRHP